MNKLTLSALVASFLLISACDQSADGTADADKSVMDSAVEMTEEAAESVSDTTSNAIDATKKMAEEAADSAIEMKDDMMKENKTEE